MMIRKGCVVGMGPLPSQHIPLPCDRVVTERNLNNDPFLLATAKWRVQVKFRRHVTSGVSVYILPKSGGGMGTRCVTH